MLIICYLLKFNRVIVVMVYMLGDNTYTVDWYCTGILQLQMENKLYIALSYILQNWLSFKV